MPETSRQGTPAVPGGGSMAIIVGGAASGNESMRWLIFVGSMIQTVTPPSRYRGPRESDGGHTTTLKAHIDTLQNHRRIHSQPTSHQSVHLLYTL